MTERLQRLLLRQRIAEQYLDYATTSEHFELICDYITHAERSVDLEIKKIKILGGVDVEEGNNTNASSWLDIVNGIMGRWRSAKA